MSTLSWKSWHDIRRRWSRSLFTIATIAVAIAGLGLFVPPVLIDRAMAERVANDRLHDVRIFVQDLPLTDGDLEELGALPGVEAVDFRTTFFRRVRFGDRREDLLLVGVKDFADQQVNVVSVVTGEAPGATEVLTDPENSRTGRLDATVGDTIQVEDNDGGLHPLVVSGTGRSMEFSQTASESAVVLYAPQSTVNEIAGAAGGNSLEVRLTDPSQARAATDAIQQWLTERYPDVVFNDLPDTREAGTWPGQDVFDNFSALFYVGAFLALISAVALISNTMTTMVAEQRREIAIMKAIGGRRLQVATSFLRTAGLLALAGSVLGALLGIPFGYWISSYIGTQFLGVTPAFGIAWTVVIASLVIGVVGTTLAAVPALIGAARTPVRVGLQAAVAPPGGGASTRLLRHIPLPTSASIGLRNITRRKARALGTVVQVGLAVGVALGLLAFGVTVGNITANTWDTLTWDVLVFRSSNVPFDDRAVQLFEGLDGVGEVQPVLYNNLEVDGSQIESWGIPPDTTMYHPQIEAGRWLNVAEDESRARVAVVGHALAANAGVSVGDTLTVDSARGEVDLEVVGIDSVLANNAESLFLPLSTFQEILGRTDANAYWLTSSDPSEAAIDRLGVAAEETLAGAGYPVSTEIRYVEREANLASNRTLVGVIAVMGIPIVAIGLIGLVNMMTMNVIERTGEIGILRSLGARSHDVRGIFRSEALAVSLLGWVVAVPVGWVIGKVLVELVASLFEFGSLPYDYPLLFPPLALVATLLLAMVVVILPLRRATGLRPGDALRYE